MPAEHEIDVAATELALGVLEGPERAATLRRVIAEPGFAREVEAWRVQFGTVFAEWPDEAPPEHLFRRIEHSLEPPLRPVNHWPAVAAVFSLIAASLLLVIVLRPVASSPVAPATGLLVASLAPSSTGVPLPAVYDPANGELRIPTSVAVPAGRAAELWMIGQDGVPQSMGLLATSGRSVVRISSADRAKIVSGLKLAISSEPHGGSPTGLPTGPIIASGPLISS